jgi:erythrin-vacuolar iron transport family protein
MGGVLDHRRRRAFMALPIDFAKLDARDVLDIAIFVEQEAQQRYDEFAAAMQRAGKEKVAVFFTKMSRIEAGHEQQITRRRRDLFADQPRRFTDNVVWGVELPDTEKDLATLTPREAFEMALQAETRAHDYYADALEFITQSGVAELLANLRDAELEHKRLIQREIDNLEG